MKAVFLRGGALVLAAALAGCTSTGSGSRGVEVTRFHLNQPIARGEIAVESFAVPGAGGPEFNIYAAAVEQELRRLAWPVATSFGTSEQVALVGVEQAHGETPPRRSPVSIGVGGGTGGYRSGVGLGVGFNLGGGRSAELVTTTLQVRIKRRSDGTVFWEGRATDQARADKLEGQPAAIAQRLAQALFREFPGESGRTVMVKDAR
jgi:hypothetical protein